MEYAKSMAKKKAKAIEDTRGPGVLTVPGSGSGTYVNLPEDKIGERIKQRREALRINYEELSRATADVDAPYKRGLTAAMLARYEKGFGGKPVLPGARELRLLCEALDVPADWLLLGINREDQAKYAVEVAEMAAALISRIESYKTAGRPASVRKSDEHVDRLARVRRPKGGTGG